MGMRVVCDGACRRRITCCLTVAALLGAGSSALTADAAHAVAPTPSYKPMPMGSFGGPGTGDGQFTAPTGIAVEPGTGNIVVADSGNNRVQVFAPGPTPTFLTSFGQTGGQTEKLQAPFGVAIDQDLGAIYVSDSGNNRIVRYTSDGLPTPTYTRDLMFSGPTLGLGPEQIGSFASPIAIDPTTHDLLVADTGNRRVSRYTSAGAFVRSFDGADTAGGPFVNLFDVAVSAAGITYVVEAFDDPVLGSGARAETFNAAGSSLGRLGIPFEAPLTSPRAVVVDPVTGQVVAAANSSYLESPKRYSLFAGGPRPIAQIDFPPTFVSATVRLAVDGGGSGRLYGLTDGLFGFGGPGVQVLDPYPIPGAEFGEASAVAATTAHLTGTVAPGGVDANAHFEYSKDGASWTPTTPDQPVSGSGEVPVAADPTGLEPNTRYFVRLVAANDPYTGTSASASFTTTTVPPGVTTGRVSDRATNSATLNGEVVAFGLQTTYHFEYGETTAYGHRAPVAVEGVAGNGRTARPVSRVIAGLQPGTTYHYRLVATNDAGTTSGDDATFTTPAATAAVRGYEMVSPVDKGGASLNTDVGFQVRLAGDAVAWQTRNGVGLPGTGSAPTHSRFLSIRAVDHWSMRPLDPPQIVAPEQPIVRLYFTLAVSEDATRALVASNRALAPGGAEGAGNLYLCDLVTGEYTLVATNRDPFFYNELTAPFVQTAFIGGADDFRWIVFWSSFALTAGATPGVGGIYRWSASGLELVSVLPDGSAPTSGALTGGRTVPPKSRSVSADGSRMYFTLTGSASDGVYVRLDGEPTLPISVSQRPGDPETPVPAEFISASVDGRQALFVVPGAGTPLTPDASGAPNSLYRYDDTSGQLTHLVDVATNDIRAVSDNADSVYYYDNSEDAGKVWRSGEVHTVPGGRTGVPTWSPSGRYLSFTSAASLTSYDNLDHLSCFIAQTGTRDCVEVYLYDAQEDRLSCASCPADGGPPNGHANIAAETLVWSGYFPQAVADDGTVYFDTPTPLVASDANGTRDVYAFSDGEARLVSRGTVGTSSQFADISPDQRDVFFTTDDRLVGADTDAAFDMYDARLGGGLSSQATRPGRAPCGGAECREPAPGPASAPPAGSEGTGDRESQPPARRRATVSIEKAVVGATAIQLVVRTSGRGRVRGSGTGITTRQRSAAAAGVHRLQVPLTKRALAARRKGKRVTVRIAVRFTPPFGARATDNVTRTLARREAAR